MPQFEVVSGTVGFRDAATRETRIYKRGEHVELSAVQARDMGPRVKPANREAALALAEVTAPVPEAEPVAPVQIVQVIVDEAMVAATVKRMWDKYQQTASGDTTSSELPPQPTAREIINQLAEEQQQEHQQSQPTGKGKGKGK